MKLSAHRLLRIDRAFWLPHQLTELFFKSFARVSADTSDHVFVIKLMGLGSIIRFASLCQEHQVDKSKITLITFSQLKEVCLTFGFQRTLVIRSNNLFHFLHDCWKLLFIVRNHRPKSIIDFERCSHAVGTFRLLLAWWGKCNSLSFEPHRSVTTKKVTIYSVDDITLEKIFLIGIERMPKTFIHSKAIEVKIQKSKILININASDFLLARRYPIESFAKAIRLIHQEHSTLEFYLTGSSHEFAYVEQLTSLLKDIPIHNTSGTWSFNQLTKELSSCALFITGDSGPVHLAVYLGVPTLALWGPTQPKHFGYESTRNLFSLSLNLSCSPCFKHPASVPALYCRGRIDCLKNLAPAAVAKIALSLLQTDQEQRTINLPDDQKSYPIQY